mmetsp:Transcript_36970/g.96872  ORF Transcript_36970/g.96872 Transcript_36970/m.96872 type:complete len:177 (-) Transcript_36970:1323-1853(-)
MAHQLDVAVKWRPFQLRPHNPPEGVPKAPDTPENPRVGARMKAAGQAVGIDFTGRCDRSPNTLLAHILMDYAEETTGSNDALAERLFQAYFTDGIFPSLDNLVTLAEDVGLDAGTARGRMTDPVTIDRVQAEIMRNKRETRGVPYFIVNGGEAFSGAHPPETFKRIFSSLLKSTEK